MPTEQTPLLWSSSIERSHEVGNDAHSQFCALVGVPPSNQPANKKFQINKKSLYGRVLHQLSSQRRDYNISAALTNTLLLSQVVLGAALTALGASESSHILVTIFGATNTIIAGLVAYLKSRGQPMRARMYRDDLERVIDEIENSEVMWLGIARGVHGYEDIDTDEVTVRSEVARLTRLYDSAVRNNTMNNPEMYMAGAFDYSGPGLRKGGPTGAGNAAIVMPAVSQGSAVLPPPVPAVAPVPADDPDQSPASAPPKKDEKKEEKKEEKEPDNKGKESESSSSSSSSAAAPAPVAAPAAAPAAPPRDPDASPATAIHPKKAKKDENPKKVEGDEDE